MFLKKHLFLKQSKINSLLKVLLLFIFLCKITPLQAQQLKNLSLTDALRIAKENNSIIQKSRIEEQIAEENIAETKELRLPEIDFHGMYSRITNLTEFKGGFLQDKAITVTIPEIYDLSSSIRMPIYTGSKINNAIKIAKQENEIAHIKVEKAANDIQMDIIATFLGIYKMTELQKIIDESIKEEQERLKEVQAYKNFGTVTKNEVLRAELQLSDRELNALINKKNIIIALHDLKTLLQLPEELEINIDTTASLDKTQPLENYSYYWKQTLQNEAMRIANHEVEVKKIALNLVKGNYYPTLSFFGNYNLRYPNYMFFPPNPYLYSLGQIGVEATYNLSGLYKNKSRVQIAHLKIELQEKESEIIKNKMQDTAFKNYTDYQTIVDKFRVTDKALDLALENYRIVRLKYLNQLVLITEMVDADNALLQAKFNRISTQIDAVMKHYEILHTAGLLPK